MEEPQRQHPRCSEQQEKPLEVRTDNEIDGSHQAYGRQPRDSDYPGDTGHSSPKARRGEITGQKASRSHVTTQHKKHAG